MELVFLVIQLFLAAGLIVIVLMQRSGGDGFGLGSGSGSNFLSGRQSANLLTRMTAILATLFILNSLWLGVLATHRKTLSVADEAQALAEPSSAPSAPLDMPKNKESAADPAPGDALDHTDAVSAPSAPAKTAPVKKDGDAAPAEEAPSVPVAQ